MHIGKTRANTLQLYLHQQYPLNRTRNIHQNMIHKNCRKLKQNSLRLQLAKSGSIFSKLLCISTNLHLPWPADFIKINAQLPNAVLLIVIKKVNPQNASLSA